MLVLKFLKVIAVALSCIRTVEMENMPYLLRFLLLSATPKNARLVISKIREQLKFIGLSNVMSTQHCKLKGKFIVNNAETLILDALKSSLRFKNVSVTLMCNMHMYSCVLIYRLFFLQSIQVY